MKHSAVFNLLPLFVTLNGDSQTAGLPQIRQNGGVKQLYVDGKPFIKLAGELHNPSALSAEYMKPIRDKRASVHLNTVTGTSTGAKSNLLSCGSTSS